MNISKIGTPPITQLFYYIRNKLSKDALNYIDNMPDKRMLNITDYHQMNALMYACKFSLEDVALKILSTGFSNPSQVNDLGKTALIYACSNGMDRVAILIIQNGNCKPSQVDEDSCTALMWACANSMTEVALTLILTTDNLNYKQQDADGDTALIIACSKKLREVSLAMIKTGMSRPEIVNDENDSALMIALDNGMTDVAIALAKTGKSVPETVNDDEETALIIACRKKNQERVSENISKSFDDVILELFKVNCNIEHISFGISAFDYYTNIYTTPNMFGNTDVLLYFVQYYYQNNQMSDVFIRNMEIICNAPLLRAIVRRGIPSIQIDEYCKPPVQMNSENVSFAPLANAKYDNAAYYNTRGNKRKIESTFDAEEIHSATAIPRDDDYYINDNGERVQIPLMSTGEGELIPKRLGGKRRKTSKKMKKGTGGKITRKKTCKKGKRCKITRKKTIKI
jgi:ankyrin repeat protein